MRLPRRDSTVTVGGPIQVRALWTAANPLAAPAFVAGLGLSVAIVVAIGVVVVVLLRRRAWR